MITIASRDLGMASTLSAGHVVVQIKLDHRTARSPRLKVGVLEAFGAFGAFRAFWGNSFRAEAAGDGRLRQGVHVRRDLTRLLHRNRLDWSSM